MPANNHRSLFIFAGEPSGDLLGCELLKHLFANNDNLLIEGVGGPLMRATGMECLIPMEKFLVMGFSAVIKALPHLIKNLRHIANTIVARQYDVVVLIDYPGFNLRLASMLRKRGYNGKIIHYVAPSVWAWKKGRIRHMEQTLDLLITTFPFEAHYFDQTSLTVRYAGHPLLGKRAHYTYDERWKNICALPTHGNIISIFPGSRKSEIIHNLSLYLEAALAFHIKHPHDIFAISVANDTVRPFIEECIASAPQPLKKILFTVPHYYSYELMRDSSSAIATSGTVTLELALHKTPTVVAYNITLFNWIIAKYIFNISLPYYCIVNIICQNEVFPEIIGRSIESDAITQKLLILADDDEEREKCIAGCEKMKELLQHDNASEQAVREIEDMLYG